MVYVGDGFRNKSVRRFPVAEIDDELMAKAQNRKGHISVKAVSDEYDRLLRAKLKPHWNFFSRLFGRNRTHRRTEIVTAPAFNPAVCLSRFRRKAGHQMLQKTR